MQSRGTVIFFSLSNMLILGWKGSLFWYGRNKTKFDSPQFKHTIFHVCSCTIHIVCLQTHSHEHGQQVTLWNDPNQTERGISIYLCIAFLRKMTNDKRLKQFLKLGLTCFLGKNMTKRIETHLFSSWVSSSFCQYWRLQLWGSCTFSSFHLSCPGVIWCVPHHLPLL